MTYLRAGALRSNNDAIGRLSGASTLSIEAWCQKLPYRLIPKGILLGINCFPEALRLGQLQGLVATYRNIPTSARSSHEVFGGRFASTKLFALLGVRRRSAPATQS